MQQPIAQHAATAGASPNAGNQGLSHSDAASAGEAAQNVQSLQAGVPNRSSTSAIYRPLNVKDALSYLDQVKVQFYNQADVYNNFLDIMKDFKSQSIDTPGVIDRVSTLFRGHPNLIQGFNTFLPPGYRIECSLDPSDPNPIRVTTPTGTTTTRPSVSSASYNQRWGNEEPKQPLQYQHEAQLQQQQDPQQGTEQQQNGGAQIEFNHAISYVNKVKTRFASQPDSYKQFLEILQTYQREQRPIAEVYEQVTVLFAQTPDLLDDFKQFLPDTSNQAYIKQQQLQQQAVPEPKPHGQAHFQDGYYNKPPSQLPPVGSFQPPTGTAGLSPNSAQQHLYQQHQQMQSHGYPMADVGVQQHPHVDAANSMMQAASYGYENNYNQEAQLSSVRSGVSQQKPRVNQQIADGVHAGAVPAPVNPTLVPGIPEPVPPAGSAKTSSLLEEISFFDKVKKAIGNKQSYNDFLKLLNLFSQDIIDKATLVERVESFIGDTHPDLIIWFKLFVGYEDAPLNIENITFKKHQLELSLCKAFGPSYRQLPKAETFMPCSGRDEMCWEVLNDEWVGHPTWASEDSGFIAHRKNQYEEILFKIEEERLEFDYYMESNLRTIQILETIANRIANMTPEQKANFKLPPGLGHNSTTIYKKVIRKIYDKDRGFEVIDALHENPAVAVPIVLKRLKQKDEEWKRALREWNKVWREMEQKVFYKSLDHLGLTFKQADKKLLTVKQLVSEISTVKIEQQNKRLHPLTPKPQEQLNYEFKDNEVLMDILNLADVFIFHSSNYSSSDREKLAKFFESFVSLFFGIPSEFITASLLKRKKAEKTESEKPQNGKVETRDVDAKTKKRGRENDLLRDVLKKQSKSKRDGSSETAPGNVSNESEEEEVGEDIEKSSDFWIETTNTKFSLRDRSSTPTRRFKYNLFCNTTIYVFFRHLRTLYERLEEIKGMNESVGSEIRSRKYPQFAKDLNLISHQLEDLGVQISGNKDCYLQVLDLSERLIEGEVEHQWFEESLRQGYRNKAYKIYTIDKVVQAMVKHMHSMVTDAKTSEMMLLFENDRVNPTSTVKDQILYRMLVRSLMAADENMFKISFTEQDNSVNIQFVLLDDLTINDHENVEEKYNYYVTSYVMSHPTEGVPASKINMPFSKSFIENIDEDQCEGRAQSGLKVFVCENSYRLFFEKNTQDEFTANSVYNIQPEDAKKNEESLDNLKTFLDDESIGWKLTLEEDQDTAIAENLTKTLFEEGVSAYLKSLSQEKDGETDVANAKSTSADKDTTGSAASDSEKNDKKASPVEITQNENDTLAEGSKEVNGAAQSTSQSTDKATTAEELVNADVTEAETSLKVEGATELAQKDEEGQTAVKQDSTKHDADTTVVQESNDTTIQQDPNDTTADEVTVNHDDGTMIAEESTGVPENAEN